MQTSMFKSGCYFFFFFSFSFGQFHAFSEWYKMCSSWWRGNMKNPWRGKIQCSSQSRQPRMQWVVCAGLCLSGLWTRLSDKNPSWGWHSNKWLVLKTVRFTKNTLCLTKEAPAYMNIHRITMDTRGCSEPFNGHQSGRRVCQGPTHAQEESNDTGCYQTWFLVYNCTTTAQSCCLGWILTAGVQAIW